MASRLIESLATTEELAELFSDGSILRAMLEFEVALARVESRLGIIPVSAAQSIAAAATPAAFDVKELSRKSLRAGTPSIPLVRVLTEAVRLNDDSAAAFVHWGATSQDVSDTALILLLKQSQLLIDADLARCETVLRRLSEQCKDAVMLGRTLLQPGPPTTFGLKAAGWLGAVHRGRKRLTQAFAEALVIQFGGAVGTLAMLGDRGSVVARELAAELGLACPDAPWHTHRDRLGALICACGVLTGSLGKVARDVGMLMQNEVGEATESGGEGRGGSSTMPQKRNPIGCTIAIAAATRMPGMVASYLAAMVQEHERSVGGSQSEWPTIAAVIQATGVAAASMAEVTEGLRVDTARMQRNLVETRGVVFAEKAMAVLAAKLGREKAHQLLDAATRKVVDERRTFAEVLGDVPEIRNILDDAALKQLTVAEDYLGSAESFRTALLRDTPSTQAKN
ncbi:MAG TPA: 3-carboxy-cis,cis-muconate cycloisomerase [Candidatus Sulfotelmatobacter sp.]|nr:3-carboxy-cis,cis-muconate cycloisomerase [Candidatus Sulfotelmatobacter sp.]